jgi:hypothetical protein
MLERAVPSEATLRFPALHFKNALRGRLQRLPQSQSSSSANVLAHKRKTERKGEIMTKGISMSSRFTLCMARGAKNIQSSALRKISVWSKTNIGKVFLRKQGTGEIRVVQAHA